MKYKGIALDEHNHPFRCPICDNEEITGDYCIICGTNLLNMCFECNKPLPGNARYCPNCGRESSYFTNKILGEWNEKAKPS